jgi:hypothetical protein
MAVDNEATVEYTVKELLQKIQNDQTAGFAQINQSLVSKADKGDLERLSGRMDAYEGRLGHVEEKLKTDEAAQQAVQGVRAVQISSRQWAIGIAAILVSGGIGATLGQLH